MNLKTYQLSDYVKKLAAFDKLGYSVEWRVINAADYGRAQRRRRVFIYVFRNDLPYAKQLDAQYEEASQMDLFGEEAVLADRYEEYVFEKGFFAEQFPIQEEAFKGRHKYGKLDEDIVKVSDSYAHGKMWNTGIMRHGVFYSYDTRAIEERPIPLREVIQSETEISEQYYLTEEQIEKFEYLRGSKKIERVSADGHRYTYSEGGMSPTDDLDLPGRTMLTSEGSVNRSTHLLKINGRYRFMTPIEAERLQDFPDDWTKYKKTSEDTIEEVTNRMRLFFMGNALVTGIVERIGNQLEKVDRNTK